MALRSAGIGDEDRLFNNLVSTVLDGSEQFKVEYPLMEKILEIEEDDNLRKRTELPEANIVEWCKAHSWELVAKDLIKLDPMVSSLERRVKALRRYFGFGKGADFLDDACNANDAVAKNPKFLKLSKTRFSEHHLKTYRNSFLRLPQLSEGLLIAKQKKLARKHLQQQIVSKKIVACNYGITSIFQIIANNSKSLQDDKQPPWVYVKKHDAAVLKLDRMVKDLRTKTNLKDIFVEFPELHERLSIFTRGAEVFETKSLRGQHMCQLTDFALSDTASTWESRPDWLDEDDWSDHKDNESGKDDNDEPEQRKRKRKRTDTKKKLDKLSLSKEELAYIKTHPEGAELEIKGTDNELTNYVATKLLFLVVRVKKIIKVRVSQRIRKVHRLSLCHDFDDLFLFSERKDWQQFSTYGLEGL